MHGHFHISNSPSLSDVQISQGCSTLIPLTFAIEGSDFSALLTALLTTVVYGRFLIKIGLRALPLTRVF